MTKFAYRNGVLCAEDVALPEIARQVATPFYCYSATALEEKYRLFAGAMPKGALVAYAVKANGNIAVIKTLARLGAGADIVSMGELRRAMAGGVPPSKIVFSGVGKKPVEIAVALDAGIFQFNVESEAELDVINEIALAKDKRAPVALRVNPDIDARTHAKISTGKAENKFGIGWSGARAAYAHAAKLPGIEVVGIAVHIGSQITDLEPFRQTFAKVGELVRTLRADGHKISRVDLGGGLGVPYAKGDATPRLQDYSAATAEAMRDLDADLIVEPGRFLTAEAGVLVAQVTYLKQGATKHFVILDAGMNDLLRPALYDAWHEIVSVAEPGKNAVRRTYDVVGPVCESTDLFARDRELPELAQGDLVAILTAGAYGAVLASGYNARPLVPEVLVKGGDFAVVRARRPIEAIMAEEHVPAWLKG